MRAVRCLPVPTRLTPLDLHVRPDLRSLSNLERQQDALIRVLARSEDLPAISLRSCFAVLCSAGQPTGHARFVDGGASLVRQIRASCVASSDVRGPSASEPSTCSPLEQAFHAERAS